MLVVDGSNVPSPCRPWHRPPNTGFTRLVADVARLTRDWEICADVVFDGYPRGLLRQSARVAAVRVLFSQWQSADSCIVDYAHAYEPGTLFVVTSDNDLARRVRALGAHVASSQALRRALDIVCSRAYAGTPRFAGLTRDPHALLTLDASRR